MPEIQGQAVTFQEISIVLKSLEEAQQMRLAMSNAVISAGANADTQNKRCADMCSQIDKGLRDLGIGYPS